MASDQHQHPGRRQHFQRGRRGHDRRGERRPSPAPQAQEPGQADTANVDQIVKDIKARIAQRHGIDLSAQQIQELAARRLEAILDPRTVKPGLLDQLRKAAGAPADIAPAEPADAYTFEDHTIYDTHNGLLRFIRKLLAPVLKLFFNPNPISAALNAQARVNREAARREAQRERTQAEWNALHYTVLQRLVTEVSRVSLEMQSLALRLESLSTRADFTERRIRGLEAPPAPPPAASRSFDVPAAAPGGGAQRPSPNENAGNDGQGAEGRRRRRRRRGRRGNVPGGEVAGAGTAAPPDLADADEEAFDDGPEADGPETDEATTPPPPPATAADARAPEPPPPVEPPSEPLERVQSAPEPVAPAVEPAPAAFESPAASSPPPGEATPPAPEPTDR